MTSLLYRGHRFGAKTAALELRSIYLPEEASWLAEYLHEVTVFSKGKYDDQADSPLSSSNGYKKPGPNDGYYEWLRLKAVPSAKPNSIGRGNEALSRVVPRGHPAGITVSSSAETASLNSAETQGILVCGLGIPASLVKGIGCSGS